VLFRLVFSLVRGRRSVELLVKIAAGANTGLSVAEKALEPFRGGWTDLPLIPGTVHDSLVL